MLRLHRPLVAFFPHVDHCTRVLPIAEMISACSDNSCVSFVDGSDAVGNVTTNVNAAGCDIYIAAIDNYVMATPGTTVLVVKPALHRIIDSLVMSYYYGDGYSSEWLYTGLSDVSALLSSFHALQFIKYICFGMREYCRNLAAEARDYLSRAWGVKPIIFPEQDVVHAIIVARIPGTEGCSSSDALHIARTLMEWKVNVGVVCIRSRLQARIDALASGDVDWPALEVSEANQRDAPTEVTFLAVRLSCHIYNEMTDVKRVAAAIIRYNKLRHM
jgi:selenocysteine lyase/cysteine desulfurase